MVQKSGQPVDLVNIQLYWQGFIHVRRWSTVSPHGTSLSYDNVISMGFAKFTDIGCIPINQRQIQYVSLGFQTPKREEVSSGTQKQSENTVKTSGGIRLAYFLNLLIPPVMMEIPIKSLKDPYPSLGLMVPINPIPTIGLVRVFFHFKTDYRL